MSRDKRDFEDDGRTITDMSALERPSLFGHLPRRGKRPGQAEQTAPELFHEENKEQVDPQIRKWYILGALKAGLLIGLAFIVGLGLLILLMLLLWGAF